MTALPPLPLPADPALAAAATALEQSGQWADLVDHEWRYAFMTGELRMAYGGISSPALPAMGTFYFGPESERERIAHADPAHLARMQSLAKPGRRPAAVLFADVESSAALARRLPTASYFALGRRLFREFDRCIVEAGGIPGRQAGDGVVAFFLAETGGSESAAARACITAARALREAIAEVALRSELEASEIALRFGMHWGSTLYVGQVITVGRSEVTALGDEVNETARIEACASGGRALASKALIERLDAADAAALGLDPDQIAYTPLAELAGATEKARRDAPAVAVCEV